MFFNFHVTDNREDGSTKTVSLEFEGYNIDDITPHIKDFLVSVGFEVLEDDNEAR